MSQTKVQLVSNIVGNVSGGASFTGIVTASNFVGNLTGTASNATTAGSATTATAAGTAYGLTGSPDITVGTVTGNLTGTATTATAAGTAYGLTGNPTISVSSTGVTVGTGASIHQPASNVLTLGTNNTEKLRITSTGGLSLNNGELVERVNIVAGKLSDNTNINLENGMVHFFTTTETTTSTPNIRVSSTVSLDSVMAVGDTISVSILTTTAAAAYSANITIDGGAVTEKWLGGSAPTAGGASGNDLYTFQIIKTGSATFTVLANISNFA